MALAGGNPGDQNSVAGDADTKHGDTAAPTLDYSFNAKEYEQSCQNAKSREDSDLCAQWTAAVAAEEAADLAGSANNIAGVSAVLSFVGIILVVIALRQTNTSLKMARKANKDGEARAAKQTKETASALAQATRGAEAMSKVAETLERQSAIVAGTAETNKRIADSQNEYAIKQLRSYISVIFAYASYQDSAKGIPFSATCTLVNGGSTAAKEVRCEMMVDVLGYPITSGMQFPETVVVAERGFIPPQQSRDISRACNTTFLDEQVRHIRERDPQGLCVWGRVDYVDEFENARITNFGISIFWVRDMKGVLVPRSEYLPGMNDCS